ncbi:MULTISPECIES: PQQ-binding-like beta-propeller repeat protein [unclassified Streptomyces]|uniref:outer membrane protein assembly factor BamB family protein n=1 Tax=unclassified Streptomyces TaxID=2593676 RepID=UPI003816AA36
MSQPPQPPNDAPKGFGAPQEPPASGFGAPQEPPAGGFGAPTPPPPNSPPPTPPQPSAPPSTPAPAAPPAYGYPQAPGTPPPAGAPGYGYPQTPPQQPGYGYPGQPGGQPGYGYPTQPPTQPMAPQYGAPGAPGPGGKKPNTQLTIIIAAAVAVALIVGGGIWYATGKDDGKKNDATSGTGGDKGAAGGSATGGGGKEKAPANTSAKVLFQTPQPQVTDLASVHGSWLTDKVYVKSGVKEIVGYDPAKGTQLWKLPLTGNVCQATTHVSADGKTAFAFETMENGSKYASCTEVAGLDLNTGKLLWQNDIKGASGDRKSRFDEVTLGAGTVAAGGLDGGAAWDLNTGKELWKPTTTTDQCKDVGYGGGDALVAVRKCGDYDHPTINVQPLDPKTGQPASTYKMLPGIQYAHIVSTKPLVLAADVGDTAGDGSGISDFFSVDDKTGKLLARIPVPGAKYAASCDSTSVEKCKMVTAGNGKLYVPTEQHANAASGADSLGRTNEIVAFDLATGQPVPGKADAGDGYTLYPLRMDGNNVIAYKDAPYNKGTQVVSIDGGSLQSTLLLENPADRAVRDAITSFSAKYSDILYGQGRLYLGAQLLSKPYSASDAARKFLFMATGTG